MADEPASLRKLANQLAALHGSTANTYGHGALWDAAAALRRYAIAVTPGERQPATPEGPSGADEFIAAAMEAQANVDRWPADMRRNNVVAVAAMPTHRPPRQQDRHPEASIGAAQRADYQNEAATSEARISSDLRALAEQMGELAGRMKNTGSASPIYQHGIELAGAASIAHGWADGIDEMQKEMP